MITEYPLLKNTYTLSNLEILILFIKNMLSNHYEALILEME